VQKIYDYLILKWRVLISGIMTYLFSSSALQRKAEYYMYVKQLQRTKGGTYINRH